MSDPEMQTGQSANNPDPPQTGTAANATDLSPVFAKLAELAAQLDELRRGHADLAQLVHELTVPGGLTSDIAQAVTMLHQRLAFLESIAGQYWREHFTNRAADHLPGASLGMTPPPPETPASQ